MRIAFIDVTGWAYTPDTVLGAPMGGMQSAACHLAEELVRRGHAVALHTGVDAPSIARGVSVWPTTREACAHLSGMDAVVVIGGCTKGVATFLRQAADAGPRLALWTGHATDQPAVAELADPGMRALWDSFVFVSDWQRERFVAAFGLPAERCAVLRNAIAPAFQDMFANGAPVLDAKTSPPVLAYTSTPFRGLNLLLAAFPLVREAVPGTRLKVFSSMAVYHVAADADPFARLYEQARATEGVEYLGAVPQPELARALREVTCLAYPNTYEETSCIAVMEAMAAGCLVATVARGALPETLAGFGATIPPDPDLGALAGDFAQMLIWLLQRIDAERPAFERRLSDQVRHANAAYTWPARAAEWEGWLARSA